MSLNPRVIIINLCLSVLTGTSDGTASSRRTTYKFLLYLYPTSASSASSFTTVLLDIYIPRDKGAPGFEPGTRSRRGQEKMAFINLKKISQMLNIKVCVTTSESFVLFFVCTLRPSTKRRTPK